MATLYPTTELAGAQLSTELSAGESQNLKQDPKGFVYSQYDFSADDVKISVVENDANTVHLILPCYEGVPSSTEELADDDMSDVSGGEILMDYTRHVTREGVREYTGGRSFGSYYYRSYSGGGFGE